MKLQSIFTLSCLFCIKVNIAIIFIFGLSLWNLFLSVYCWVQNDLLVFCFRTGSGKWQCWRLVRLWDIDAEVSIDFFVINACLRYSSLSLFGLRICRFYRITRELKNIKMLPALGSEHRHIWHLWLSGHACYPWFAGSLNPLDSYVVMLYRSKKNI